MKRFLPIPFVHLLSLWLFECLFGQRFRFLLLFFGLSLLGLLRLFGLLWLLFLFCCFALV